MLQEIPYFRLGEAMPDAVARLLGSMPVLKPVIPDPGARFQLVHEDDVARAFVAGVRGPRRARPLQPRRPAARSRCRDLADALGWYSVPIPKLAVEATAGVRRRGCRSLPDSVAWIHSVRKPVLMKTDRAGKLLKLAAAAHGARDARRRWSGARARRGDLRARATGAPRGSSSA